MTGDKRTLLRKQIEPYWYLIILFALGATIIYIIHLTTAYTPDRVALTIAIFDFDIFWYGILIVGGISLGSFVVSRVASERARADFEQVVPANLRQQPLGVLDLPEEIERKLTRKNIATVGQVLLEWGIDPRRLNLKKQGQDSVAASLVQQAGVDETWIDDAPWRQWNPDHVWGGLAWCLIFAVIGARLYHVLTPSPSMAALGIHSALDYFRSPMQLINIRSGGLGIFGGIIGGAIGLYIYARRQDLSAVRWADIGVIGVALGQAIGRWGNFFNQELYGTPTNLPWAVRIDEIHRLDSYIDVSRFHPAFLYESLWNFLAFIILLRLARHKRRSLFPGDLMALYLVFYSVGRILMELVRLDSRTLSLGSVDLGIPVATVVSIAIAVPMVGLLVYRHLLSKDVDDLSQ